MTRIIDSKGTMGLQVRGYANASLRANAVRQLIRRGFNYFIGFRDVQSEFALQFGKVTEGWAANRLTMTDCYSTFYGGRRISCVACGKRHPFRPGYNGQCPGAVR